MSEEIWFFAHLIVPLTDVEGRMRLNNKNKTNFILYCVRLSLPLTDVVIACAFVTKWRKNVLTFDNKNKKVVFYFVLCSLNRTFVPKIGEPW